MFPASEGESGRAMDVSPVAQAESVSGKTTPKELLFLMSLAQDAPAGTAVEVGALHGRSMLAWSTKRRGRGDMLVVDDLCRDTLKRNLPEDITLIKGISWEVAENLPCLAFCFIDADHGEVFAKDLAAYVPLIVPGGVIAFHDYEPDRFAVKPLIDEWQESEPWD